MIAGVITDDSSIYPPSAKPTIVNPAEACIAVWGEAKEALGGGALRMGCSEAKEALGGGVCVCVCRVCVSYQSSLYQF